MKDGMKILSENEIVEIANNVLKNAKKGIYGLFFNFEEILDEFLVLNVWNKYNCFSLLFRYDYKIRYNFSLKEVLKRSKKVMFCSRYGIIDGVIYYASKYKVFGNYYVLKEVKCNEDIYNLYRLCVLNGYDSNLMKEVLNRQKELIDKLSNNIKEVKMKTVLSLMKYEMY
ncbi:MAG: hypothetical protein KQA34_03125 [Candidatus Aenigmarchaeota archaeon]|nr:hypothetical protein [Candidatus Aenigmarchaeota archaeon]